MSEQYNKLKIVSDDLITANVFLNDVELKGVQSVALSLTPDNGINIATISLIVSELDVDIPIACEQTEVSKNE